LRVKATCTTDIDTLSLHDALPICVWLDENFIRIVALEPFQRREQVAALGIIDVLPRLPVVADKCRCHVFRPLLLLSICPCVSSGDRKSTRLNSSHVKISYAVFCLK